MKLYIKEKVFSWGDHFYVLDIILVTIALELSTVFGFDNHRHTLL